MAVFGINSCVPHYSYFLTIVPLYICCGAEHFPECLKVFS